MLQPARSTLECGREADAFPAVVIPSGGAGVRAAIAQGPYDQQHLDVTLGSPVGTDTCSVPSGLTRVFNEIEVIPVSPTPIKPVL